jgi:hypothetical protein
MHRPNIQAHWVCADCSFGHYKNRLWNSKLWAKNGAPSQQPKVGRGTTLAAAGNEG